MRVVYVAQRTGFDCGPASLAAVTDATIDRIASLARTTERGTDHAGMIAAARTLGVFVAAHANSTIAELGALTAAGMPVIVGWWSRGAGDRHLSPTWTVRQRRQRDRGHYSVISGVGAGVVTMIDPEVGFRELAIPSFLRHWYDTDTPRYVKVSRWCLAVNRR